MCTVLLPPGVNSIAVNKYININNGSPLYQVWLLIFRVVSECILSWHLFMRITCCDVTTRCLVICFSSIKDETFHSSDDIIYND
jgi:hypothetical protein